MINSRTLSDFPFVPFFYKDSIPYETYLRNLDRRGLMREKRDAMRTANRELRITRLWMICSEYVKYNAAYPNHYRNRCLY